jgi:predicted aspartyl protease
MWRIPAITISIMLLMSPSQSVYASVFYEWTDENGVTHFADSPDEIPAKYRSQVKTPKVNPGQSPAVSQGATAASTVVTGETPSTAVTGETRPSGTKLEVPFVASEGTARRIIINVTLNDLVTVPMALDTGSPGMVVSLELAERLGLFAKHKDGGKLLMPVGGIGGTAPAVLTIVDSVSVEGARSTFVPTTVTERVSPSFEGLIGMDFMAGYTVSIDSTRHVLVFEQIPASPETRGGHDQDWWRRIFTEFRSTRDLWAEYAKSAEGKFGTRKTLGDFQLRESERLLQRLNVYASDNAVPLEWR